MLDKLEKATGIDIDGDGRFLPRAHPPPYCHRRGDGLHVFPHFPSLILRPMSVPITGSEISTGTTRVATSSRVATRPRAIPSRATNSMVPRGIPSRAIISRQQSLLLFRHSRPAGTRRRTRPRAKLTT